MENASEAPIAIGVHERREQFRNGLRRKVKPAHLQILRKFRMTLGVN